MSKEVEVREALERCGLAVLQIEPLGGGMSAAMFRVGLGDGRTVVARVPSEYAGTLSAHPVQTEAKTLRAVREAGVPVAEVVATEPNLLLLEYLPGAPTANPADVESYLEQMALALAKIHTVPTEPFDFLPVTGPFKPFAGELNRDLREPEVVERLLALGEPAPEPVVLRHGDFWPGNLLWQDGCLTGVIDWENACLGPAVADLSISRLDVFWVFGREAMEAFTRAYVRHRSIDLTDLPYWDLRAALRPMGNLEEWPGPYPALGRPDITLDGMRQTLLEFVKDALVRT